MISCPNCSTPNSILSPKCIKCGSIIQARVPNLDLFGTIWELIEKPKDTFRKICLSEQKNYIYALFSFSGFWLVFSCFRFLVLGNHFSNLISVIFIGLVTGPVFGILFYLLSGYLIFLSLKYLFKSRIKFRNMIAVVAYSSTPVLFMSILILPVELIAFGQYFYMSNPGPHLLKPMIFYVLLFFEGIGVVYTFILLLIGSKMAGETKFLKSLISVILSHAIVLFLVFLVLSFIKSII